MKAILLRIVGQVRHYRIIGAPTAPNWVAGLRVPVEEAWCDISTTDGQRLNCWGGEVWPSAWPELFATTPPTTSSGAGQVYLTAAGQALIASAN